MIAFWTGEGELPLNANDQGRRWGKPGLAPLAKGAYR
jgi:hypothetical protein